jgi:hypothetical protein
VNSRPLERPDEEPDEGAAEPCSFCTETPTGRTGHEGLALDVERVPASIRLYSCFTCFFCGTRWARRRLNAREFEWRRLVA